MKLIKKIIGIVSMALALVFAVLYFVTKSDPTSALAVKFFYPENVTGIVGSVYGAMWISFAATFLGGLLSLVFSSGRRFEVVMIILYAIGFLAGLLYSLLVPCLLWVSILAIVALMFSVSYSQIENDFNGGV